MAYKLNCKWRNLGGGVVLEWGQEKYPFRFLYVETIRNIGSTKDD